MGFNPFQHFDPGKIFNDVQNQIHSAVDDAIHAATDNVHHITDDALNQLKSSINQVVNDAQQEIENDFNKVKDALSHVADLKSAFTAETIKAGINTCLSFIQRYPVLPTEAELGLSVVTVFFDDINDTKIANLQKYLNETPTTREQITDLIFTLMPTKLHIGGDFSLFSDAIGARAGVTFTSEQVKTVISHICDDIGIS